MSTNSEPGQEDSIAVAITNSRSWLAGTSLSLFFNPVLIDGISSLKSWVRPPLEATFPSVGAVFSLSVSPDGLRFRCQIKSLPAPAAPRNWAPSGGGTAHISGDSRPPAQKLSFLCTLPRFEQWKVRISAENRPCPVGLSFLPGDLRNAVWNGVFAAKIGLKSR